MEISLLIPALIFSGIHESKNTDFGSHEHVIDIAGKQRMLSQKLAKAYILKINGNSSEGLEDEINSCISIFEKNYSKLKEHLHNLSPELKDLLSAELYEWENFKTLISKQQNTIDDIINVSETLLFTCDNLVFHIEKELDKDDIYYYSQRQKSTKAKAINISGKQRMLSQRLALYFTAYTLTKNEKYKSKIKAIRQRQREELSFLIFDTEYTEDITANFQAITLLFEILDTTLSKNQTVSLEKIVTTCNKVTTLYNTITGQYSDFYYQNNFVNVKSENY